MDILQVIFILIVLGAICFTAYKILTFVRPQIFRPQTLKETVEEKLDPISGLKERGFKGNLYLGFDKKLDIVSYYCGKVHFQDAIFDKNTKEIKASETTEAVNFLFIKTKNPRFIFKILGIKNQTFILDYENMKDLKIDYASKTITIPPDTLAYSYAGQWVFSAKGIEFCHQLSLMRLLEQSQMYIENIPDKYSHMEMIQAQNERTARITQELEKQKYEDIKKGKETTVT